MVSGEDEFGEAASRAVFIRWIDATGGGGHSATGWVDIDRLREQSQPGPVLSIGFVVREDKESIVLVQSVGSNDGVDNWICIPKKMITEIWEIDQ